MLFCFFLFFVWGFSLYCLLFLFFLFFFFLGFLVSLFFPFFACRVLSVVLTAQAQSYCATVFYRECCAPSPYYIQFTPEPGLGVFAQIDAPFDGQQCAHEQSVHRAPLQGFFCWWSPAHLSKADCLCAACCLTGRVNDAPALAGVRRVLTYRHLSLRDSQ